MQTYDGPRTTQSRRTTTEISEIIRVRLWGYFAQGYTLERAQAHLNGRALYGKGYRMTFGDSLRDDRRPGCEPTDGIDSITVEQFNGCPGCMHLRLSDLWGDESDAA